MLPGSSGTSIVKGRERQVSAHSARVDVTACGTSEERSAVLVPCEMGQPGHLFCRHAECNVVTPGNVGAESRQRNHNDVGFDLPQYVKAEAELVHHSRRVVLDDDVGVTNKPLENVGTTRVREVQCNAALVAIYPVEVGR